MIFIVYLHKENEMKKLIDIPDEIVKDLKILAINKDTNLKNFIEQKLVEIVAKSKSVKKTPNKIEKR